MNITPAQNMITPIENNIKSRGPSRDISVSEEALEKLESSIKEGRFDTFRPGEDFGIRRLEEVSYDPLTKAELSTSFTNEDVSPKARELSMLMDERDEALRTHIAFGLTVSRDQLAQHFGEVGRKIDEAYSSGEISEQEYKDLNKGLAKYTETVTAREERRSAVVAVLRDNALAMDRMMKRGASRGEIEEFAK